MLDQKQTAWRHSDWFIWHCMLTLQWRQWSGCGALWLIRSWLLRRANS